MDYPQVTIDFCAKCKWHNRAVWYLQEILQTFGDPETHFIPEVSLRPRHDLPGLFQVTVKKSEQDIKIIYKRKFKKSQDPQTEAYYFVGFPDSKLLKQLLRNELFPNENLGHIDRRDAELLQDCVDCKIQE